MQLRLREAVALCKSFVGIDDIVAYTGPCCWGDGLHVCRALVIKVALGRMEDFVYAITQTTTLPSPSAFVYPPTQSPPSPATAPGRTSLVCTTRKGTISGGGAQRN